MANATIKITQLPNIGNGLAANTLLPVVNTAGTAVTEKVSVGNVANYILTEAGNTLPAAFLSQVAYSVANAAQPNITSVGNLSGLTITTLGNFNLPGGTNGYVLQTNGNGNLSWVAQSGGGGNGTPGGSNTQVQFNDAGEFGGSTGFTYNKTNTTLTANNFIATSTANLGAVGNVKITGGSNGQVLTTFGNGTLSWSSAVPTSLVNGNSNVIVNANSNVSISASGNANVVTVTGNALYVSSTLESTGGSTGSIGTAGGLGVQGNIYGNSRLYIGAFANATNLLSPAAVFKGQGPSYVQIAGLNTLDTGSADFAAYGDNGNDTFGWADMGFTGSNFADANYTITGSNDGYLFAQAQSGKGGNLVIATGGLGTVKDIIFATGGFLVANEFARISHSENALKLTRTGSALEFADGTFAQADIEGTDNFGFETPANVGFGILTDAGNSEWTFGVDGDFHAPGNITLDGGTIYGGTPTEIVTNLAITDIQNGNTESYTPLIVTLADDIFSYPVRGVAVISGVNAPVAINDTWYFEAWYDNQIVLFQDDTYTMYVYGTDWPAYVEGGGEVDITINTPTTDVKINSGGYVTTFTNDGRLVLPTDSDVGESTLQTPFNANLILDVAGDYTWEFNKTGSIIFPTLTVDIHNGGEQTAQTLQFGDNTQQAIITGPTPSADVNAQRLIIQGQRGNGQNSEGGDVYFWAGDADTYGGDIKIYAGDADNVSAGYGGYINIQGGKGFNEGGYINITGGQSTNSVGAYVGLTGGQGSTTGGEIDLNGGYGGGSGGNVNIIGGVAGNGLAEYGNINITAGASVWVFGNDGNLTLPANTFAVNYANGTQVNISGGGANTGNVTFDDVTVQGVNQLNLSAGPDFTANLAYLQVRAGDVASHIHLDTGNNQAYDLIVGDDQKYVQVSSTGDIVMSSYDGNTSYTWTFDQEGNLMLAGGESVIRSVANSSLDPLNPNVSTMTLTPSLGYSSQSLVLDPTAPGHIHLRAPSANIDEPLANIFLGGEESSFEVGYYNGSAPNLYIHSGNNTWTFNNSGSLQLPAISLGSGVDEQTVVQSQRKIIPGFRYSVQIDGTTPTVVYTASSITTTSMKILMQVQHQNLGIEFFEINATGTGVNTYYSVNNRVGPVEITESDVLVDFDGDSFMQVTLTINSGAATSWVTYDSTEFGIAVD